MTSSNPQGPGYLQLPLWRDVTRLLVEVMNAVRHFPRYHKCTLGSDLRRQAMNICCHVVRFAQCFDAMCTGVPARKRLLTRRGQPWCEVCENAYIKGGKKKRQLEALWPVLPIAAEFIQGN